MNFARALLACTPAWLSCGSLALAELPPAPVQPLPEQIRMLRQIVEKQGQQIDELRSAVGELSKEGHGRGTTPSPVSAPMVSAPASTPPAITSTPEAAPAPAVEAEAPRAEKVEPAHTGPQHTVAKGETLTSIAKHYNISITELHKANKVVDDRKLQIGQVLNIPLPQPSSTSTEKKETP